MKRTQMNLEPWQYEGLQSVAYRKGASVSSVLREAVAEYLSAERSPAGLMDLCGVGRDPSGPAAREHDAVLYADPSVRRASPRRRSGKRSR